MVSSLPRIVASVGRLFKRTGSGRKSHVKTCNKHKLLPPSSPSSVSSTCASEGRASIHDSDSEDDDELICQDKILCCSGGVTTPRLCELAEVPSLRWKRALAGRHLSEMPEGELRALVLTLGSAVPLQCRVDLWPRWFLAAETMHPNFVADPTRSYLSSKEFTELQEKIPDDVARLIDLDLPRTMPHLLGMTEQCKLKRVLHSFAALHPEIGYCQGLNNIAAVFVALGFDDAMATAGVESLVTRCCPSYHMPGLPGFISDAAVLKKLVSQLLSEETLRRLAALDVPLEALAAQHFLALAAGSDWELAATVQLWDLLLLEGRQALMASFVALLQLYLPPIEANDADNVDKEPVELFRHNIQQGMRKDPAALMKLTRDLLPQVAKAH